TIMITIQSANGEIGTLQPIKEINEIAQEKKIFFHSDGTSSIGQIQTDVQELGLDSITLPSNTLSGPKGMGALYLKAKYRPDPIILGGGQERGLRSGTENSTGIIGMAKAYELANNDFKKRTNLHKNLRDDLIKHFKTNIEDTFLNGHPIKRVPNNAHFRINYIEGEALTLQLDDVGIAISTGAACAQKTLQASHVVTSLGILPEDSQGLLQVTFGRPTKKEEVDKLKNEIVPIIKKLRIMSPLTPRELRIKLQKQ
ncbi:MAG: cysteine desulfurase family protein, partial [Candidatus Ranarchaeia archaeon]